MLTTILIGFAAGAVLACIGNPSHAFPMLRDVIGCRPLQVSTSYFPGNVTHCRGLQPHKEYCMYSNTTAISA